MTEYELISYLHAVFPLLIALLRILSESLYVDDIETTLFMLNEIILQQKVLFYVYMHTTIYFNII